MSAVTPPRPTLLDDLRRAIRLRHYSPRTEVAYVAWTRRFVVFHGRRHPAALGDAHIAQFLTHLAEKGSSASTQNQALNALMFLYDAVLHRALPRLPEIPRAKRPERLPTVLSREEVTDLLAQLHGVERLMASLLYGCGLRLMECAELRVKDVHFDRAELVVREGKGGKDRVTMLPQLSRFRPAACG